VSFQSVVYRSCGHEAPLWGFPNLSDGRYNRAGRQPTQYLAFHPMTPWAEVMRNLNRRTPDEARQMRVPLWAFQLTLADDPVDISFDNVDGYSLDPEDLVADDQTACRALSATLYGLGVRSFTAPSAALPGTKNLVVLEAAAVSDYHLEPVDPVDWPAAMLAQDGRCPENLWDNVHYRGTGTPHPALQAWQDGDEFEFEQPGVTPATLRAA
jgi:RES domain-containing protein